MHSNRFCVLNVTVKTNGERFNSSNEQKRVKRRQDAASGVLNKTKTLRQALVFYNNQTGNQITVPAEVLCRAMNDNVRAQFQRALKIRRHERVVYNSKNSVLFAQSRRPCQIGNSQ